MNGTNPRPEGKSVLGTVMVALLIVAVAALPVVADDTPTLLGVIPSKSEIANLAFANQPVGYRGLSGWSNRANPRKGPVVP